MTNQNENGCAGCLSLIIALFVVGLLVSYWQLVLAFVFVIFVFWVLFKIITSICHSVFGGRNTSSYRPMTTKFNSNDANTPFYTIDMKADAIDHPSASKTIKPKQKSSNLVKKRFSKNRNRNDCKHQ